MPAPLFYDDRTMKSKEDRIALLAKYGVDINKDATVYCSRGIYAAWLVAAMSDIFVANLSIYTGGWTEWSKQ